jgi:hypothetical protein
MRVPFSFMKGSGSLELDVNEPGRETGQSAPSSSPAAAAAAVVVFATTATAPATTSATIANMMTVERIVERPELMITGALLPGDRARVRRSRASATENPTTLRSDQ